MNECGNMPLSVMQLLASALMVNAQGEVIGFNFVIKDAPALCGCVPYIGCDTNGVSVENVISQGFTLDECGKIAIMLVNCDGTNA